MDITPTGKDEVTTPHIHNHSEAFLHMFEGKRIKFPTFKHEHPPVIDINKAAATAVIRMRLRIASSLGPSGSVQQSRKPMQERGELAGIDQKIGNGRYRGQNEKPISHGRTPVRLLPRSIMRPIWA